MTTYTHNLFEKLHFFYYFDISTTGITQFKFDLYNTHIKLLLVWKAVKKIINGYIKELLRISDFQISIICSLIIKFWCGKSLVLCYLDS